MVHQNQARFALGDFFHAFCFQLKAGAGHAEYGQQPDEDPPKERGLFRFFMFGARPVHNGAERGRLYRSFQGGMLLF